MRVGLSFAAMGCGAGEPPEPAPASEDQAASVRTEAVLPVDWEILEQKLTWAYRQGLDTLPIGDVMVALGRSFVGTPYRPHTLEIPGPERLVVNFEALDCVTFVENVLALARFVRSEPRTVLGDPDLYRRRYEAILGRIRYRGGRIDGYPSRLHYFSEWIADGEGKGLVADMGETLGGIPDPEPIDFMSTHSEAYAQLSDPEALRQVIETERVLNDRPRRYLPEHSIAEAAHGIENGDVIAATSTVPGLDVAHTGLALWIDGSLHLMHAPLVGEAVQISTRPLAQRIQEIGSQDGIMVARPQEPGDLR